MCLAVPGKVTAWIEREPPLASARVEFGGVAREVNMQCVPEAYVGDYVLVHAGIAISRIDPLEAQRVLSLLDELALHDDDFADDTRLGGGP
jgi:hydrogenase expression/formation protein HypC